ncbi:MAG: tail fiber domain-containing protein [Bacteroidetes bacterium]|nr:tail fiber domain-containing protein [Bacteroidota bacterium]
MKQKLLLLLALFATAEVMSQNVGIGTTTPQASALLELNSVNKGLLLPRLADTSSISSPVKGLLIYNNTNNRTWVYNGSRWQPASASADSIWYAVNDSVANSNRKIIGINMDTDLIAPQASLQVNGSLLVQGTTLYTSTNATALQTYTMPNSVVVLTLPAADSVYRIYDPGGTGNYTNNMQGNIRINPDANTIGYKVSSAAADFGLASGDTLWISKVPYPNCRTDYEIRFFNTNTNPADFIVPSPFVYFIFRSNADGVNGKGFNLLVKELFAPSTITPVNTAGMALVVNTSDGTFRAGLNNTAVNGSMVVGNYSKALGYRSLAFGNTSTASGGNAIAIGDIAEASGNNSMALGFNTTASGISSTAMGQFTTASGDRSTSIGSGVTASGDNAIAMGTNLEARGYSGTVVGVYNSPILFGPQSAVSSATPLFIVGNGDNNSTLHNALVVLKSGNVGIGSDIPSENLVLNDAVNATLQLQVGGTEKCFVQTSGNNLRIGNYSTNPTGNVVFRLNGADRFTIFPDGDATLTGTLTQNSDIRFKQNITPLSGAMRTIMQLNGYHYYWKPEFKRSDRLQIGLLAQNVETVLPELVTTDANGTKSVAYQNMIPVLVEGMKEQQRTIEQQQQQIESLRMQVQQLLQQHKRP